MNKNLSPNSLEDVFNIFHLFEWVMDLCPLVPTKYQFSTMATANAMTTNLIGAGLTES
jgi:hypothetical protein